MSASNLFDNIRGFSYEGQRVGHESELYSTVSNFDRYDNVVPDINMVSAGLDQTVSTSYDQVDLDEVEGTPLYDLADSDGGFKIEVQPEENYRVMEDLAGQARLLVPDHIMGCLPKALENEFRGTGHYHEAEQIHDGIFEFLNFHADVLEVKDKMGLERYSHSALKERYPDKNEDDFIIEAAKVLRGNTVIMTYDADYLECDDIDAAAPKAVEHILSKKEVNQI